MTSQGAVSWDVVNVSVDAQTCAGTPPQVWLASLAEHLGQASGPRLVFLPPLFANVAVIPSRWANRPLPSGMLAASLLRPWRGVAVRFAFPSMRKGRLRWANMHDRVDAVLREAVGGFARKSGAIVMTTVLADHPRKHWEAWPERGALYHSVQTISTEGEPLPALRQRRPALTFGARLDVDPDAHAGDSVVLPGGLNVRVQWHPEQGCVPMEAQDGELLWVPVAEGRCEQRRSDVPKRVVVTEGCTSRGEATQSGPSDHVAGRSLGTEVCEGVRVERLHIEP